MSTLKTGGSAAAQALSTMGGQGVAHSQGQGIGMPGAFGGGSFAALMQALTAQTGTAGAQGLAGGVTGQSAMQLLTQANGQPSTASGTPTLGQLLSLYNKGTQTTGGSAQGAGKQHPILGLLQQLQDAGIDLASLPLPPGLAQQLAAADAGSANPTEGDGTQAAASDETKQDGENNDLLATLLALVGAANTDPQVKGPGGQNSDINDALAAAGGQTPQKNGAAGNADAGKSGGLEAFRQQLAALTPEDRAKIADALQQLRDAAQQTKASDAQAPKPPQAPTPPTQTDSASDSNKPAPTQQALQTLAQQAARNQSQPQAQADTPAAQDVAASIGSHLSDDMRRDLKIKVSQDAKPAKTGGPNLLSANTTASVMAASQAQDATAAQAGKSADAPGQTVAGVATSHASTARTDHDLLASLDKGSSGTATGTSDTGTFADSLDSLSQQQQSSINQLDSSIVKISRTPMTHQAPPAQVALHLSKAIEQGVNRFIVELSPASLGKVDVHMNVDKDGRVHAMLHVERPETLQLLQKDAPLLHQALENAGLKPDSGSLNFSLKQDGNDFAFNGNGKAFGGGPAFNDADVSDAPAPVVSRRHEGQLDVTI